MTTGLAARGRLRASDADREQVLETLKVAFVAGRLTKDELDARAGAALAARTYAELRAITADIPGRHIEPPLLRPVPVHARRPVSKKTVALCAAAVAVPPALGAAFLTYYGGFLVLFLIAFIGLTVTLGPDHPAMARHR